MTVTVAMVLAVPGAGCCGEGARDPAVPTTVVVVNPPWFATPPLHVADESAHGESPCGRELLAGTARERRGCDLILKKDGALLAAQAPSRA